MHVQTSHQILVFGDSIKLFDSSTGNIRASADLIPGGGDVWTISAGDLENITAPTKNDAVYSMIEHARKSMPGYPNNNLSVSVPQGLISPTG